MLPSTTAPPLAPNFLVICWRIFFEHRLLRGAGRHAVDMAADRADEGDAHHAGFEFRRRRMALGDREGVDDEELDLLVADGLARHAPAARCQTSSGERLRLQDERAALDEPAQRIGVAEHLVVRRDDDFDVFELGVGDQHRLGAERDVVVGRRAALFRAVFRRRLRVQFEHAGEDVGQELAGGDGAVAAHRMEADAERRRRQQVRVRLRLERHQLGFGIGRLQLRLQLAKRGARASWRRTASRDRRTARCGFPCS